MKFINLRDREINVNISKYNIDWDKKVSKPQKAVKDFLFPYWKFDHCLEEFRIPNSLLRIDLINVSRQIIVEVSPRQHQKFNSFLHGDRFKFLECLKRDQQKRDFAEKNHYTFVELLEEDLSNLSKTLFLEKYNVIL